MYFVFFTHFIIVYYCLQCTSLLYISIAHLLQYYKLFYNYYSLLFPPQTNKNIIINNFANEQSLLIKQPHKHKYNNNSNNKYAVFNIYI